MPPISVDEIEQAMNDNRPVEILPDGTVVLGEREEEPSQPLTYRQPGLGDNY